MWATRFRDPIGNETLTFSTWKADQYFGNEYLGSPVAGQNFHLGEDWNLRAGYGNVALGGNRDAGQPVYAVANGTVVYAAYNSGWQGDIIVIRHDLPPGETNGHGGTSIYSFYGHLTNSIVSVNDEVQIGQPIAELGTPATFSAHLHFEMRWDWQGLLNDGYIAGTSSADAIATAIAAGWLDPREWIGSHFADELDDDFAESRATSGELIVGSETYGCLEQQPEGSPQEVRDTDWFKVELEAGTTYSFALRGLLSGNGTLANPTLRLKGPTGSTFEQQTAESDGASADARMTITVTESGTYYLVAYSSSNETGTYRLSAVESTASERVLIQAPNSIMLEDFGGPVPENFQVFDAFYLLKDLTPAVISATRVRFTIPASVASDGNPGLYLYVTGTGFSSSGGVITGNITSFELKRGTNVFLSVSQLDMSYGAFDSWYTSVINALPPSYTGLQPDNDNGLNDDDLNAILDLSLDLLGPLEVTGNADENDISGGVGNDVLNGGGGTDFMIGHEGADQMDGGDGTDIALYAMADAAVWVDLVNQSINRGEAAGDTLTSIEVLWGSQYADRLYGDDLISTIERFDNLLVGGKGNDKLYGRGGDDALAGGAGRDLLNGGDGSDWTMYFDSENDGVIVNLSDSTLNTGIALGDTFVSIENIMGSDHGDHISGNNIANELHGEDGNDLLFGLGGNDVLYGGYGFDTLNGAAGADTFVYETAYEGIDTIVAFDTKDRIELRINTAEAPGSSDWANLAYDLATGALLNTSQQFIVNGPATGTGPQFLYNSATKTLNFDIDGAGAFSAIQLLQITGAANLSASDIYIVTGDFSGF